jgi:hypothetical protein
MELLDVPAAGWAYQIVEPLFCAEGCINGPGIPHGKNLFERKNDLIRYAREKAQISAFPSSQDTSAAASAADISGAAAEERGETAFRLPEALKAVFIPAADIHMPDIAESRILEVFEQTGKSSPDMQLNCGACGYKSCRDNAIAVVLGMAEPEMCIPICAVSRNSGPTGFWRPVPTASLSSTMKCGSSISTRLSGKCSSAAMRCWEGKSPI